MTLQNIRCEWQPTVERMRDFQKKLQLMNCVNNVLQRRQKGTELVGENMMNQKSETA